MVIDHENNSITFPQNENCIFYIYFILNFFFFFFFVKFFLFLRSHFLTGDNLLSDLLDANFYSVFKLKLFFN